MFAKALFILASISAVFAYPEITEPVNTTVIQAGASSLIIWKDNGTAPTLASFGNATISIYIGSQNLQSFLQPVTRRINVGVESQIAFVPDATIGADSDQYFIRMESLSLKDGQYPAMVFSAKFRLTGMTGKFNETVLSQINGQSSTSRPSSTGSTGSKLPTPSLTGTSTSKASSAAASASRTASAAESIIFQGGWLGFLLSALLGVTIL